MSEVVPIQSIMIDLGLALLLGSAIGLERQLKQRHSGLATHGLVALGAAAYASLPHALGLVGDLRMGSQVVTGIGFLVRADYQGRRKHQGAQYRRYHLEHWCGWCPDRLRTVVACH